MRSRQIEANLGAVAQIRQADLGASDRREPWILERRLRPSEVSGTVSGNRERIALAKQGEPDKMHRALEDALHEHPAPTLSRLSSRLGYSSSNVLKAHEPDLCEQLSARRRSHVVERRADLERRATAALGESPPPSLLDVCKRLGITVFFMNKYFPAVRQRIAERYRQWVSSVTVQRREKLSLDVRNIAAELQGLGLYPSVNKIVDRLPAGCCSEWKTAC